VTGKIINAKGLLKKKKKKKNSFLLPKYIALKIIDQNIKFRDRLLFPLLCWFERVAGKINAIPIRINKPRWSGPDMVKSAFV